MSNNQKYLIGLGVLLVALVYVFLSQIYININMQDPKQHKEFTLGKQAKVSEEDYKKITTIVQRELQRDYKYVNTTAPSEECAECPESTEPWRWAGCESIDCVAEPDRCAQVLGIRRLQ